MEFIKTLSVITDINSQLEERFRSIFKTRSISKNEFLLEAGQHCNHLYFVVKGGLRGYYFHEDKEITNWFALEGDFATSFYPFISQKSSYEYIQVIESGEVLSISHKDLNQLYADFPETEKIGRVILEDYYSKLEERLINIQFKSAKERYNQLMENRPVIIQRVALGHLASYLGITQETLSRIRSGN